MRETVSSSYEKLNERGASCDVLFHAHAGGNCQDLAKFRLVNDKCDASMMVLHNSDELSKCFEHTMQKHESRFPGSICKERGSG